MEAPHNWAGRERETIDVLNKQEEEEEETVNTKAAIKVVWNYHSGAMLSYMWG